MRIDPRNLFWLFARFAGRISREAFWLGSIFAAILMAASLAPFIVVDEEAIPNIEKIGMQAYILEQVGVLGYFVFGFGMWSSLAIGVKRVHDLGWPGLTAIALLLPPLSFFFFLLIGLLPGQPGANRYGAAANVRPEHV